MKIVIISSKVYPLIAPRSFRTTQLAIELAKRGHDVTLYGILGDFDYTDFMKETNVKIKNIGKSRFGLVDSCGKYNRNIFNRAIAKILGKYILFPEIELFSKIKKILKKEQHIDLLITSAIPYMTHFAVAYSDRTNIDCWVSDCGDPFFGNKFVSYPFYLKRLEKKWSLATDYITIPIEAAKKAYLPEAQNKIHVIPQGFNFSTIKLAQYNPNSVLTFAFAGIVYKDLRDPTLFLEYLCNIDFEFKFIVYTNTPQLFLEYGERLNNKLEIRNFIPREQLLFELSKIDFLVNIENKYSEQSPSKLIDYMLTKRPIISITSDFREKAVFEEFVKGNYAHKTILSNMEDYNIENVASKFIMLYMNMKNNV